MITKAQFLASLQHECDVAVHLHTKLSPDSFGYRPSPTQRTTLELLQYLGTIGIGAATCMVAGDWKRFAPFTERAKQMRAEEFPAAMARQKEELTALIEGLTDAQLATQMAPMPAGGEMPLGAALLNGPLKWLTAYKLQLFLYAKATGATNIGTSNAWGGVDRR
ncbi:MAG TPA: hypothetical protein VFS07_05110 [Gemmatimonadales bacterium]|jgi:hypothetical protein|nr:hypothetical protein [Gemmatimonadales bacterium]